MSPNSAITKFVEFCEICLGSGLKTEQLLELPRTLDTAPSQLFYMDLRPGCG